MLLGKRAKSGQVLLKELYSQPILNANQISARLKLSHQAASALAKSFEGAGILRELTGYKRNRLFVFSEYLSLFNDNKHSPSKNEKQRSSKTP